MPRSIILGVVGDSAAGKTTLTRGLVRVLGEDNVTHVCVDDYHRYDRRQRAERNITPLHPDCNYMDIMAQDLAHLRQAEPFLKPVYQHKDGTFGPLVRVEPSASRSSRGCSATTSRGAARRLRRPDLPRTPRGAPPPLEGAARLLAARLHDRSGARRARPARGRLRGLHPPPAPMADIVVAFTSMDPGDQTHLDAELTLCDGLPHPDFTPFVNNGSDGPTLTDGEGCRLLRIPGRRSGPGGRDRGGDLEPDALRDPSARPPPRRVHGRHRPAPLRVARARPAAHPLPPGHRACHDRPRRRGHARARGRPRGGRRPGPLSLRTPPDRAPAPPAGARAVSALVRFRRSPRPISHARLQSGDNASPTCRQRQLPSSVAGAGGGRSRPVS